MGGSGPAAARVGGGVAALQRRAAGRMRRRRARLTSGTGCPRGPAGSDGVQGGGAVKWGQPHSAPDSIFKPNQIYFKRIQICPIL
jgi:hypothetical protein